jgi:hypothetical protein
MMVLTGLQEKAVGAGLTNIVQPKNLYASAKDVARILGKKNVDAYFSDPDAKGPDGKPLNPMPPPKPDPKMQEMQAKAQTEAARAQADIQIQREKTQSEIAVAERKAQLDERLMLEQFRLKEEEHKMNMIGHVTKLATTQKKTGANGSTESSIDHELLNNILERIAPTQRGPKKKTIHKNPDGSFTSVEH